MNEKIWKFESGIRPAHLIAGFGAAQREMLSTCLALYDDSKLLSRLNKLYNSAKDTYTSWTGKEIDQQARELDTRQHYWFESSFSDDQLRVLLWLRLRQSLVLPARLSLTRRGCSHLADDITAALINAIDPPGLKKKSRAWLRTKGWLAESGEALTLQDVVIPVLDEFFKDTKDEEGNTLAEDDRHRLLEAVVQHFSGLDSVGHESMLKDLNVNRINDEAIIKVVLTSTTLGGIGASVNLAGFSAYILAAKASAAIPLVSGPGLVSLLSVLAAPITLIGGTGVVAWWSYSTAKRKANAAISARIVAMLTIQGLQAGYQASERLRVSFMQVPGLEQKPASSQLPAKTIDAYRRVWAQCKAAVSEQVMSPEPALIAELEKPLAEDTRRNFLGLTSAATRQQETQNALALTAMTLGDVFYSAAAIDPMVIAAADFSRLAEIDGPLAFSRLAEELLNGTSGAVSGGINQLKGYVAERAIAGQLSAAGHTVSFPDASNSPGWDIMLDGQPFQVKFHAGLSGIRDHFARYDYPLYANTELAGSIPEELADRVFFVDGVSNELVSEVTEHSLETADGLLDTNIPAFAFLISTTRGTMAYKAGSLSAQQAVEQVLLDGSVRVGLAAGGGVVGAGFGFLLFGPAGAWVFGAGAPILAQSQTPWATGRIRALLTSPKQKQWLVDSHQALDDLQSAALAALQAKREQFQHKIQQVPDNKLGSYIRWRLQDEEQHAAEVAILIRALSSDLFERPEQRAVELLRWIAAGVIHPALFQQQLAKVNMQLKNRPAWLDELDQQRQEEYLDRSRNLLERIKVKRREVKTARKDRRGAQ